jgi:hypothetical protein
MEETNNPIVEKLLDFAKNKSYLTWDEVTELNLYFGLPIPEIANEYIFQFTSGSTATDLIISGNVKWSTQPDIKPNKIYQISILNGLGTILEFDL